MKQRILTGWTFTRALYVALGTMVIIQSIIQLQWVGVLFGTYFASMGIFRFGCASGNCSDGSFDTEPNEKSKNQIQTVEFEEVKTK
ncbi:MAG: hypothetical protein ABI761_09340 [Saprospiraceae bacterium]